MKTRMMTATAVALMLCAPAFAQTTTTTDAPNSSATMSAAMPQGWNEELGNAFFSDSELGTLRTDEEIGTNWANLSAEQKAQVTGYCDTMDTASASGAAGSTMSGGASASATTDTTASANTGNNASPSIAGDSTPNATADTAASGGVSGDTTASTSKDGAANATGGMDAGANINVASMERLCSVVGDLD